MDIDPRAPLRQQMQALAAGDRAAFRPVFDAIAPVVRRFARASLADDADVEDAVQRTMIKLFESAHRYDAARDVEPWAVSIAAWEVRTVRRARGRARDRHATLDAASRLASPDDGGEAALDHQDALRAAEVALGRLSAADRAVIVEALEASGPLSARLRKRKQRALTRLRAAWARVGPGGLV